MYREYLHEFLMEGDLFHGTNIWLTNLPDCKDVFFAHNQSQEDNFLVLDQDDFYAFGNGDIADEWEK